MSDQFKCSIDECRKIFLELSLFWKLSLIGFVFLLGLGGTVFVWGQTQYNSDMGMVKERMHSIEESLNDVQFLKVQSDEILDNQRKIISYFEQRGIR